MTRRHSGAEIDLIADNRVTYLRGAVDAAPD